MAAIGSKWQLASMEHRDFLQSTEVHKADNRDAMLEAYAHLPYSFNSTAPSEVAAQAPENCFDAESFVTAWVDSIRPPEDK